MKVNFIVAVFLLGLIIILFSCSTKVKTEDQKRPNIIFLMDDQHRWDALGVVNNEVITPNLDKLAREGVHFTQAVCQAPMCIASRYSMMLGLYPNQIGILRNEPGLPDEKLPNLTLPQALKDAGYETAGFGKTHWAVECGTRGFETRFIGQVPEIGANMMVDIDPEAKKEYDTETLPYGAGEEGNLGYIGETSKVKEENHRDGWVFKRCLEYINRRKDERPLFLYLSFLKPHAGHNVPEGFEEPYGGKTISYAKQPHWESDLSPHAKGVNTGRKDNLPYTEFWKDASPEQWEQMTMRYYANCTWIDDMFGRTMEALKEKGLLDNAIIIYLTDHGEMLGERYYRFNKYCLYESSVRIPMILSGSALPKSFKGKTDKRPVELTDVYPTILKAAGINVPETLPGINLLSAETRTANFCGLHERADEAAFMWRTEKCKLILRMNRKENAGQYEKTDIIGGEFYDLEADPQEWENSYGSKEFENQQNIMTDELLDHLKKLGRIDPHSVNHEK
jgi:arylsulfatase